MQISISQEKKPKKRKRISLINYVIILLFSFLSYFIIFGGISKIFPRDFVKPYVQYSISLDGISDESLKQTIISGLDKVELNGVKRFVITSENAQFRFLWREGKGLITNYYIPVSHVYAVGDTYSSQPMYVSSLTPSPIFEILEEKYPAILGVENIDSVLDKTGKKAALIELRKLDNTYKILTLNGKYFLEDLSGGITIGLGVEPLDEFVQSIINKNIEIEDSGNDFSLDKVGTLRQTGVTAITRNLASKVDKSGNMGYPALKISSFLKSADLTHISNEISFVPGCTPSFGMRFCSRPEYIKTLEDIGVDIIELTGNHNNDYGAIYNTQTINTYVKKGWKYFGGGLNTTDSKKILYVDLKDTKIAFIGYNYYDTMLGTLALAGTQRAGGNSYSVSKMTSDIAQAKKNADLVIVDFQFQECYSYPEGHGIFPPCYKPLSAPDQQAVFRKAVDLGADIVVGTQAHQPQTYEEYKGKMIFYGLGNLFFDQTYWIGTRQGLILTHYLYDGKVIQTRLTTTYYEDDMQTYVTSGSKRKELLDLLYQARD